MEFGIIAMITIVGNGKFGNALLSRIHNAKIWNKVSEIEDRIIIICVPIKSLHDLLKKIENQHKHFMITTKGMSEEGLYPSDIIKQYKYDSYSIFGGPNLSKEIYQTNHYTYSIIECNQNQIEQIHINNWKLFYRKENGLEIINVMKNILAIFCGFISIYGNNIISTLITIGIQEMKSILARENKRFDNLYLGDIIATTTSTTSRNYQYGVSIREGHKFNQTAEGKDSFIGFKNRYKNSMFIDLWSVMMLNDLQSFIRLVFFNLK